MLSDDRIMCLFEKHINININEADIFIFQKKYFNQIISFYSRNIG